MTRSFLFLFLFLTASSLWAQQKTAKDYFRLGMQLYAAKDYQGSYFAFEAGLALDPKNAAGYQAMGDSLYYAGRQSDAYVAYQKALELNPQNTKLAAFFKTMKVPETPTPGSSETPQSTPAPGDDKRVVVTAADPMADIKLDKPKPTAAATPDMRPPLDKNTWVRVYFGFDFALLADFNTGMTALANSSAVTLTTAPQYGHGGILVGADYGIKIDPGNAFSISLENVFTQSQSFNNGVTDVTDPGAMFQPSFSPDMVGISLNYFAFIPGAKGSRTYFQIGAGVYEAVVGYTGWDPSTIVSDPHETGTFTSTAFGGTFGLGETFAIGDSFGLDLWARARIVSFSSVNADQITDGGTATTNGPWTMAINQGNGAIAVVPTSLLSSAGYRNVVLDYSGFDGNVSFNFYF